MDYKSSIQEYLSKDIDTFQKLDLEEINHAMQAIHDAWYRGASGEGGPGIPAL